MSINFKYVPTAPEPISGREMLEQTEQAFNELGLEIDASKAFAEEVRAIAQAAETAANVALGGVQSAETLADSALVASKQAMTVAEAASGEAKCALATAAKASDAADLAGSNAAAALLSAQDAVNAVQNAQAEAVLARQTADSAMVLAGNAIENALMSAGRYQATEDITLYVRQSSNDPDNNASDNNDGPDNNAPDNNDGPDNNASDDNNDGLSIATALASWAGVIRRLAEIDPGQFGLTIDFGPGEWPGQVLSLPSLAGSATPYARLVITGAGKTLTKITEPLNIQAGIVSIKNMTLVNLYSANPTNIDLIDCKFIGTGQSSAIAIAYGAACFVNNVEFEGLYGAGVRAYNQGPSIILQGEVKFTNNPSFTTAFAYAGTGPASIFINNPTMLGSFTGKKWRADSGGLFPTQTEATLNALIPGTIDGTQTGNTVFGGRIMAQYGTVKARATVAGATGALSALYGDNITITRTAAGTYQIAQPYGDVACFITPATSANYNATVTGTSTKIVRTFNASGTLADCSFEFMLV